jgi:hypothetical protein
MRPTDDETLNISLASWAIKHNITQSALSDLLKLLKNHGHAVLPSDGRTLLGTPRRTLIREVKPGFYWHAGLENGLVSCLSQSKYNLESVNKIELAINIDGLPLSRSSSSSLWPILGSLIGLPYNDVLLIGAYHG